MKYHKLNILTEINVSKHLRLETEDLGAGQIAFLWTVLGRDLSGPDLPPSFWCLLSIVAVF